MRRSLWFFVLAVGLASPTQQAAAQSRATIACGNSYVVQPGDTLRELALRAYSNANYQLLFNANTDVLRNPNLLIVGQNLRIPCLDGAERPQLSAPSASAGQAPTAASARTASPNTDATPFQRKIKFLTGSDYAPFTDEDLREGGMFTDLVRRAMARADDTRGYRITFVNDWGPHLSILLPEGAFDLGFPWFKPDCSKIDRLSEAMAARCTNFDFSHPFYEVVIGFYVRREDEAAQARSYADLLGKTICRPRGYFTFDLEQEGLKEPDASITSPATPSDCFEMLANGAVDVVSLNVLISEEEIKKQGLTAKVAELSDLAGIQTLHVISPKTNPYGRTYLTLINRGLRQVRESGEWFEVVSRHLSEHALRTQ